ncbi:MAG: nucleotide-binding protein, PIN domain-containing protein [Blastocatellia bacterium]|nr:nucleotide-binding protein, PIN domain-containing protein [Blastocatellia bacterium]
MKPIIVDTNILFAAMRSASSRIREILRRSDLSFYAPNFLVVEIFKHKEKILRHSKASEAEVYEFLHQLLAKIQFINEDHISLGNIIEAYRLCKDVDEKDTIFVALTLELEGEFWTRDEALKVGLVKKGFSSFFGSADTG